MSQERMREAAEALKDLEEAIEAGAVAYSIRLPKNKAALALRISESAFDRLETEGEEIRISVENKEVVISLWANQGKIDEAYKHVYAYAQALIGGQSEDFLETCPLPSLAKEIIGETPPEFLPDEDFRLFLFKAYALWLTTSRDQSLHPSNLF